MQAIVRVLLVAIALSTVPTLVFGQSNPEAFATAAEKAIGYCETDKCIEWHVRAFKLLIDNVAEVRRLELLRQDTIDINSPNQLVEVEKLLDSTRLQQARLIQLFDKLPGR